jgi:hypothetical protein
MRFHRNVFFSFLAVLIVILVVELASFAVLSVLRRDWAEASQARNLQGRLTADLVKNNVTVDEEYRNDEVVHPFVGFVYRPEEGMDQYGFRNYIPVIQKRSSEKVIIGIMGGSVAHLFRMEGGADVLVHYLKQTEAYKDKEIVIVNLCLMGGKQPQQLMILNYFLSLGAEFDMIINLDGFNEVSLSAQGYMNWKLFPAFPRDWPLRLNVLQSRSLLKLVGTVAVLEAFRDKAVSFSQVPALRHSQVYQLICFILENLFDKMVYKTNIKIQKFDFGYHNFAIKGPKVDWEGFTDLFKETALIWKRSSIQLHRLCRENGILYFHFLQPNQYVPDSKKFTSYELGRFFKEDHVYKYGVVQGYPYLIRAGNDLVREGVNFHNLVWMFREIEDSMYNDACCHLTPQGNQRLGMVIAHAVLNPR